METNKLSKLLGECNQGDTGIVFLYEFYCDKFSHNILDYTTLCMVMKIGIFFIIYLIVQNMLFLKFNF